MHPGGNEEHEEGHSRSPPPPSDSLFDEGVKDDFIRIFMNGGAYFETPQTSDGVFGLENFPAPTLANLETIEGLLQGPPVGVDREHWVRVIELAVCSQDWLVQLCLSFDMAIECEADLCLETLFEIVKSLFLNGSVVLLPRLVENDYIFESILGMLICDPEVPPDKRVNHMEYLERESSKTLFPIEDIDIVTKIKISLRLAYIKDSVLARMFDDMSYYTFSQTAHLLNVSIFEFLLDKTNFLRDILSADSLAVLRFMVSVTNIAKQMESVRSQLFEQMSSDPVLTFLTAQDSPLATDVLLCIGTHAPAALKRRANGALLRRTIAALHASASEAERLQLSELMHVFLQDSYSIFYEENLLEYLLSVTPGEVVFDLVAFCVCSHQGEARGYLLRCGTLFNYIKLALLEDKQEGSFVCAKLGALRLVRAFLWQKDSVLFQRLSGIPSCLIGCLAARNMIYSSVLEILTFACVNNLGYVFDSFTDEDMLVVLRLADSPAPAHAELCEFICQARGRKRDLDITEDEIEIKKTKINDH